MSFIFNTDGSTGFRFGGSNFYTDPKLAASLSHPGLSFERRKDTNGHGGDSEGGLGFRFLSNQLESEADFTCFGRA